MMKLLTCLATTVVLAVPAYGQPARMTGEKKVLVTIIQFANQTSPPTTKEKVEQVLLTNKDSTSEIFRESSGGKLSFKSVTVVGPFKIAATSAGCEVSKWTNQAQAMAKAQGVNFGVYDYTTFVSSGGGCNYKGLAGIGGGWSWVSGAASGYWTHELGHNVGFAHSTGGVGSTYGDGSDPLGGVGNQLLHAPNRLRAGWLLPSAWIDADKGGEYEIAPLETKNPALQVLRIPIPGGGYYFVSLRQAIGRDAKLDAAYRDVVTVHSTSSRTIVTQTELRARLAAGGEYTDKNASIRITALDVKPGAARLRVEQTGVVCAPVVPEVSFEVSKVQSSPGLPVVVEATIRNKNPATCLPADINVASGGPASVTKGVSASIVRVPSGGTGTVALTANAPAPGSYKLSVRAWHPGQTPDTAYVQMSVAEKEASEAPVTQVGPTPPASPQPSEQSITGLSVIEPSADTYLSSYHKSLSFGTAGHLQDQGNSYAVLLRFAVFKAQGGPVPDGAQVTSAKLRMHKFSYYNATYKLVRVADDWTEAATWNTAPRLSDEVDATASVGWEPGWIKFDVTDALRAARYGWALKFSSGNGTGGKKFASREATDLQLRPTLRVEWKIQ